jgi:ribosomal protein S18 acetylase RimI-like enzyme
MVMQIRVRRAVLGDEPTLRALRLQALSDAPEAFGSTYERECARTTSDWQRWLSPGATFIVDHAGHPGGLAAGVHDHDDRTLVHLMAMWVHPELRGSGAADALVASVVAWAADEAAREVRLHVVKGNDRARRCYERSGFSVTGRETVRDRDGVVEIEMACAVPR